MHLPPTPKSPFEAMLMAACSGVLLCLTHGYFPVLGLFALVPLLHALRGISRRMALYAGLVCGVLEACILSGVVHAGFEIALAIALEYAIFRAFWTLLFVNCTRVSRGPLWAPMTFCLVEYAHAQIPYALPNLLGDTQHQSPLLPLAAWSGTYLVGFMLVWAASLLEHVHAGEAGAGIAAQGAMWLVLVLAALVGAGKAEGNGETRLPVAVVQGGLPTWVYEKEHSDAQWRDFSWNTYLTMTKSLSPHALVVWPETSVGHVFTPHDPKVTSLKGFRHAGSMLLAGIVRRDETGALFNSALAILEPGALGFVDKRRLVLLAEGRFTPGTTPALLPFRGRRLGVIFCLEAVVPHYGRQLVQEGAAVLVVLAEGGRFGSTPVGRMHAQRSIVRAVETGRYVVHAGQHGFSTIVSPQGRFGPLAPSFVARVVNGEVALRSDTTPYVRFGPWIVVLSSLCIFATFGFAALRRIRSTVQNRNT